MFLSFVSAATTMPLNVLFSTSTTVPSVQFANPVKSGEIKTLSPVSITFVSLLLLFLMRLQNYTFYLNNQKYFSTFWLFFYCAVIRLHTTVQRLCEGGASTELAAGQ
jgi:hypothetical protein